jgi:hypothetical protein
LEEHSVYTQPNRPISFCYPLLSIAQDCLLARVSVDQLSVASAPDCERLPTTFKGGTTKVTTVSSRAVAAHGSAFDDSVQKDGG